MVVVSHLGTEKHASPNNSRRALANVIHVDGTIHQQHAHRDTDSYIQTQNMYTCIGYMHKYVHKYISAHIHTGKEGETREGNAYSRSTASNHRNMILSKKLHYVNHGVKHDETMFIGSELLMLVSIVQ